MSNGLFSSPETKVAIIVVEQNNTTYSIKLLDGTISIGRIHGIE